MRNLITALLLLTCGLSTAAAADADGAAQQATATNQDSLTTVQQTATATAASSANSTSDPATVSEPQRDENGFYIGGPVYVSDQNPVWTRSGPGTNYRITGSRIPGTKLTLLAYSRDGSFAQLQDDEGNTVWMGTKTLQAQNCGTARAEELLAQIERLEDELANYDSKLKRQVTALEQKNARLEKENSGMKAAIDQKDQTIENLDELRRDYEDRLQTRELDMQMRWWMQGAIIAFCGAVAGIIFIYLPRPKRRSKRDRF